MSDEMDDLLQAQKGPEDSGQLREVLFGKSLNQLRWEGKKRRIIQLGLVVGLFLAGIGLGRWWTIPSISQTPELIAEKKQDEEKPARVLTAAQLELEAEKAEDRLIASRFYLAAGDRYLGQQNVESALRCYRLHLIEGDAATRQIAASDSWLLLSLKKSLSLESVQ